MACNNFWKKSLKWIGRIAFIVVALCLVVFTVLCAYFYYESEYGRSKWRDRSLSKNVKVHGFNDDKYRVYNRCTGKYTTSKVDWVRAAENDTLAVYALHNKRGYINRKNGEIVIDAKRNNYSKAWVFSEGLSAVVKDGKIGFINPNNEVVIPFQFDYSDKCRMPHLGYRFHNGYCIMSNNKGELGLIDSGGKWIVEPTYDEIWMPYSNGYRVIVDDGKYGVLDSTCNVVYLVEYDNIDILPDGFILNKDGRKWQVDLSGNIIQPFIYDGTYYLNYPVGYNENGDIQYAFADYLKYEVADRYGIMNRISGEAITPAIYSDINMLSQEIFEVQDSESYDWYLIDTAGNIVSTK
jgi:hypothetical protein